MAIAVVVPRLGWSMDEGVFVQWLKEDGEEVRAGEPLFSLETEKAVQEVEAADGGRLCIAPEGPQEGDTVPVGLVLGHLLAPGEEAPPAGTGAGPNAAGAAGASWAAGGAAPRSTPVAPGHPSAASASGGAAVAPESLEWTEAWTAPPGVAVPLPAHPDAPATSPAVPAAAVSPRAARLARDLGVDLAGVQGTGRGG
ncbi:MAG: biotin/lipoyl-containing protein, partial [Candidatus Latescibacterota bacterium]